MKHIDISELFKNPSAYYGKEVTVCGWVRTSADVKPMVFIQVNDGTTSLKNLQLTIQRDSYTNEEFLEKIKPAMPVGVALKATGTIIESERNGIELEVADIEVLGGCPTDYPLQKKGTSVEFLRTIPHLRTRTNLFKAVFSVRARLAPIDSRVETTTV